MSFAKAELLTTPNKTSRDDLASFIESVTSESHLRVEKDFGDGFVRLKSSEAEKRQALQDIRSTEDILIELLRNARDASAQHIFVATQRDKATRKLIVIDDGLGIPQTMHERIFEPRVTSKLDSAHMDKWGMHGRGMALYSVSENAKHACVKLSGVGLGTAIEVLIDTGKLGEKTDQSTFPHFEINNGIYSLRGPRNILRTAAEFTLEHKNEVLVYCGSFTEIAATIYSIGQTLTTSYERAFPSEYSNLPLINRLAFSCDPENLSLQAGDMGLSMSSRSARRIINGEIKSLPSILDRLELESFPNKIKKKKSQQKSRKSTNRDIHLSKEDLAGFQTSVEEAFEDVAQRNFLQYGKPSISVEREEINISIPIKKLN